MLRENLKDSAEILFNILNQPLDVTGAQENISLLQAVLNYGSQQPEHSDLQKVLRAFADHREPTRALIQELELLSKDLAIG